MGTLDISTYPAATLFDTHVRTLTSTNVGIDYAISIWLPPGYASEQKTYPVVYVLDGNFGIGIATYTTLGLIAGNEVPAVMIVGVGYQIASYDDWHRHRARDYTPIPNPDQPGEGGAPQFLEFLKTELIPFIESNYRADPTDRAISGFSLGGAFALYALLKQPTLFKRYHIGSPATLIGDRALFQYELELARSQSSLPVKVAITVGEFEDGADDIATKEFWTLLMNRNYEGLDLKTLVLAGETHMSGGAPSYIRGLKAIFS